MRNYSDETRALLSQKGKEGAAKRWAGHTKRTPEQISEYQRQYQRKYQLEAYYKKKALKQAVNQSN